MTRLTAIIAATLLCLITAADAGEPRTICGCEDATDLSAARTPLHPSFDFATYELEATAGARVKGSSLRWHVKPSDEKQTTARLGLCAPIEGPLDEVSLWVKNPNAHDLGLRLEITDADGVRYLSPTTDLSDEAGWRQLVFALGEMRTETGAQDPFPGVDLPLVWMEIVIGPLRDGKPHTIYIDEIEGRATAQPTVTVSALSVPPSVGPAEEIPVRASLALNAPQRIFAEIQRDGATLARAPLVFGDGSARADNLRVPEWLPPGRYEIRLTAPDAQLTGPGAEPQTLAVAGPAPAPMTVSVDRSGDAPALKIGDETLPAIIRQIHGADADQSEARILSVPATADNHPFGWVAPGMAALDRTVAGALNAAPDAYVMLQVFINSTDAWNEANSDQLVTFDGGTSAPLGMWGRSRQHPDLISGKWAGEARDNLRALVEHVEASPYAHRVIGYELLAGDLGAWRPWGASLDLGDETGPLRQAAFRNYLVQRYRNFGILRDAWGLPPMLAIGAPEGVSPGPATWEQVAIPARKPGIIYPALYDPAANGAWIDMNNFRAEAPVRLIERMAEVVREAAGGKLVGACYGHMLAQSEGTWRWPHLDLTEIIGDDAVDMLTGPMWTDGPPPSPEFPATGKLYLARENLTLAPPQVNHDAQAALIIDDISARYLSRDGGLARPLLAGQVRELADTRVPWRIHTLAEVLAGEAPPAKVYLFADAFKVEQAERIQIVNTLCRDRNLLIWVYAPAAIDKRMITGRTMRNLTGLKLSLTTSAGPLRVEIAANSPLLDDHVATGLSYGTGERFPLFFSGDDKADRLGTLAETEFAGLALREFGNCIMAYSAAPPIPAEVLRGLLRRVEIEE